MVQDKDIAMQITIKAIEAGKLLLPISAQNEESAVKQASVQSRIVSTFYNDLLNSISSGK